MKKVKIEFAPGCFDHLDMTQEEIDELVKEIQEQADNGTLFENATEIEEDDELLNDIKPNMRQ
jgi:hypothetical protein